MGLTKVRQLWLLVSVFVLACAMSFVLVGCGGESDEDQIQEALDAELGVIIDPTDEIIEELAEEASASAGSSLDTLGIDVNELVSSWVDGFGYEVGTITVDGDTATAEVTISCKQLGPIMMEWMETFEDDVLSQGLTSMTDIYEYAGQTIMEKIDGASLSDTTVTFEFENDGSGWVFLDNSANQTQLEDAMIGEYSF